MNRKRSFMKMVSVFVSSVFIFSFVLSCGGGGGGGPQLTSTQKAAAGASAASGAVQLSTAIGTSAGVASGIGTSYGAAGKRKAVDTSDIAKIDPRLKDVVDKMLGQLKKPALQKARAKAGSYKTMGAPLLSTASTYSCSYSGEYSIDSSIVSGTTTTEAMSISFTNCKEYDGFYAYELSGSMTGTIVSNSTGTTADLDVANLTEKDYPDSSFTSGTETDIFVMDGVFNSIEKGASGSNSARGSFSWTMPGTVYTFSFGLGNTPVTDVWAITTNAGDPTETHTGNGNFTLGITSGQSLSLSITLASLEDTLTTNYSTGGSMDESINGRVTINWSPDLSQWGCVNGSYDFTTISPIHTADAFSCPTSGVIQVNNATVEFASNYQVTVTLTDNSGTVSEVFTDCTYLGQGMCGG